MPVSSVIHFLLGVIAISAITGDFRKCQVLDISLFIVAISIYTLLTLPFIPPTMCTEEWFVCYIK